MTCQITYVEHLDFNGVPFVRLSHNPLPQLTTEDAAIYAQLGAGIAKAREPNKQEKTRHAP